jgi:hypothetical protein
VARLVTKTLAGELRAAEQVEVARNKLDADLANEAAAASR